MIPWDAVHVSNRFMAPLRGPKNYGINSRIVTAKKYSLLRNSYRVIPYPVVDLTRLISDLILLDPGPCKRMIGRTGTVKANSRT